jgi:hypothetical protein
MTEVNILNVGVGVTVYPLGQQDQGRDLKLYYFPQLI